MITQPTEVKALQGYSIYVEFSDGVRGTVDLSHLAHHGVFRAWDKNNLFQKVHIGKSGAIAWNKNLDICPNAVYLKIRGLTFEEWKLQEENTHATN